MKKATLKARGFENKPFRSASRQEGSTQKLKARADKKREPKEG